MTENKPIIIDGIDVSSCEYYQYSMCNATKDNYGDCLSYCKDYDMKDCYFKQLTRKTQECEELKKQYNCYACGDCNGKEDYRNLERHHIGLRKSFDELHKQLDQLKVTNEQAEQKLEKIKDTCNETLEIMNRDSGTNAYAGGRCTEARQILQIIDEVE